MKGFRIVKPPTERQREAFAAYKERPDSVMVILPPTLGLPDRSWWTGLTRDEFAQIAAREQTRMHESKFGRVRGNSTIEE